MLKRKLLIVNLTAFVISFLIFFGVLHFVLLKNYLWVEVFLAFNLTTFSLFGFDKASASNQSDWRVPERFFYLISLLGGAIGIVAGAFIFRHKTQKPQFLGWIVLILFLQLGLLVYCLKAKILSPV